MALAAKSASSVAILADSWCICSLSLPLCKVLGLWNNYINCCGLFHACSKLIKPNLKTQSTPSANKSSSVAAQNRKQPTIHT